MIITNNVIQQVYGNFTAEYKGKFGSLITVGLFCLNVKRVKGAIPRRKRSSLDTKLDRLIFTECRSAV